jgi:hypothetical protein
MTIRRFDSMHDFAAGINCWEVSAIEPSIKVTTGTAVFIKRYGTVTLRRHSTAVKGWIAFEAISEGVIEAVVVIKKEDCAGESWAEMLWEFATKKVPSCFYSM